MNHLLKLWEAFSSVIVAAFWIFICCVFAYAFGVIIYEAYRALGDDRWYVHYTLVAFGIIVLIKWGYLTWKENR